MKIDFRKIEVKDLDGNIDTVDVSKVFGNVIFNYTTDRGEFDLSQPIYHNGEVELTEEQAKALVKYTEAFDRVVIREAVKQALLKVRDNG